MNRLRSIGRPRAVPLADGERILWQGGPNWRAIATRLLHIRLVAAYFTGLTLLDIGIIRHAEGPGMEALRAAVPTVVSGGACVAVLAALAFAIGRTTRYTLTTRRVVMQFGVALPATLMLPLHRIAQAGVRVRRDHEGDLTLQLYPGEQIGYIKLWPHARPWRLRTAEPMLRDVSRVAELAVRLGHALTCCVEAKRAAERDGLVVPRPPAPAIPVAAIARPKRPNNWLQPAGSHR